MATTKSLLILQSDQILDSPQVRTVLVLKDSAVSNSLSLDWATPSANRVVTFNDPLADDAVCYLAATQTISNKTFGTGIIFPVTIPAWTKYTVAYSALATAGLTNDIELFSLPAGGIIHGIKVKHSVLFSGPSITDYKISIGITGNLTKYTPAFDVDTAVTATNYQLSSTLQGESHTATTSVRISAVSTGANLSAANQGLVDVWVYSSVAV